MTFYVSYMFTCETKNIISACEFTMRTSSVPSSLLCPSLRSYLLISVISISQTPLEAIEPRLPLCKQKLAHRSSVTQVSLYTAINYGN